MGGEEAFEHGPDGGAFVSIEVGRRLERQTEGLVVGKTVLAAEHKGVSADRQRHRQLPQNVHRGFGQPGLIPAELIGVDPDPLGECPLGEAPLSAQLGQLLGELHGAHPTACDVEDMIDGEYHPSDRVSLVSTGEPARTMKDRPLREGVVPLGLDPDAPDQVLIDTVVDHWCQQLLTADHCESILGSLGLSVVDATRLRIGLSDRTLGNRLPDRRWKAGAVLRSRLTDLGVLRSSGHEALRGCVVIPVVDGHGTIVGLFGRRINRTRGVVWAKGLPGGIFTAGASESDDLTVVASSMLDALSLIGAGCGCVVAPGREKGFTEKDLVALADRSGELVVVGKEAATLADDLSALGVQVSVAATDIDVPMVLGSAAVPADALEALLAGRAVVVRTPAHASPDEPMRTSAEPGQDPVVAPTVTAVEGRDEVYVNTSARSWRIRGAGARGNCEGDLLRVALSVTDTATGRFHLDTVDLYVARQRNHFLDATITELRADREALALELAEVVHAAEQHRDEATAPSVASEVDMTDAEREEATAWLSAPDLLDRLGDDLGAMGVVGERTNLVVCYLATVSRLCERPFGVLVQSSSSAGKSTVTEAVCSLVPDEDLVSLSAITSQALYYLGNGGLTRKVLAISEEHGAASASYALKLLVSEGRLSIASTGKDRSSGKLSTNSYEIAGPVSLVMTTTATDIDPELENRLVVLGVDEDATQTQAILDAQRQGASLEGLLARSSRDRLRHLHANIQRLLDPFPVVIPDRTAEFPATATRHRRDHMKLLSIISAVTLLHQHQREHRTANTPDGTTITYLEATEEDVANGLALARSVLVRGSDNLAPQTARLLRAVEDHTLCQAVLLGCDPTQVAITRRELRELLGWSDKQVRVATDRLVALEYLVATGGGRGRCRTYTYVPAIGPKGTVRAKSNAVRPPTNRVRPKDTQVRPEAGPTSDPVSPGTTTKFAPLAPLEAEPTRSSSDIAVAPKAKDGRQRPRTRSTTQSTKRSGGRSEAGRRTTA